VTHKNNLSISGRKPGRWLFHILLIVIISSILLIHAGFEANAQETPERQWVPLGPNRVALWSFSPNYANDGQIFIATNALEKMSLRGIYGSIDTGNTWVNSSEGIEPKKRHYYTDLEFSPTFADDRTIWLWGHKTGLLVGEAYGGFYQSTDGGNTWTEIEYQGFPFREMTGRTNNDILGVVVSPNINEDGLMISAAAGEGVYQSKDKGLNWELLNPIKDVFNVFAPNSFPEEPFVALATTGSQVMISTDAGKTFETKGNGLPPNMTGVRSVAFSDNFANDRTMFTMGPQGVFMSTDAGENWSTLATPEGNASIEVMAVIGDFENYGSIAYGTDEPKIYLSDDMGKTFTSTNVETLMNYKVETLAFSPDYQETKILFAGNQNGIFRYSPPVDEAAAAAAQAAALEVEETRSARATSMAGYVFVPEESDRVETGCLAYTIAPIGLVVVFLAKRRKKNRS
jgi:photosystem II stability/assembly factor-like uncharacterized protein